MYDKVTVELSMAETSTSLSCPYTDQKQYKQNVAKNIEIADNFSLLKGTYIELVNFTNFSVQFYM